MLMRAKTFLARACADQRGNVLMLTGLGILVMIGLTGAGIDLGRQQLVKIKLQQATDAVAVAMANMPEGASGADYQEAAQRYFALNFPESYLGIPRPPINYSGGNGVEVTADITVEPVFLGVLGMGRMQAGGYTRVGEESESRGGDYDIILTMDTSGSMGNMDVGQSGSLDADQPTQDRMRTACVDWYRDVYSMSPAAAELECQANGYMGVKGYSRMNALRYAANTLANSVLGSNSDSRVALISWNGGVSDSMNFTTNYNGVYDYLRKMIPAGDTNSATGMAKAQEFSTGFSSSRVNAVVLLTDGENNCADWRQDQWDGTMECHDWDSYNNATLVICSALKQRNIMVYTIAFGGNVVDSERTKTMLSTCASGTPSDNLNKYFFMAPDGATLQQAFNSIVTSVKNIRIVD